MKGLQSSAPPDLQVWARRRKQALHKQLQQSHRSNKVAPTSRAAPRSAAPPMQPPPMGPPRARTAPALLRRPMQPIAVIQPTAQRVVLQHSLSKPQPSNLKVPLRSTRQRLSQQEMLKQRMAAQRKAQLAQMVREREANARARYEEPLQVAPRVVERALHDAYRSEATGRVLAGKQHLEGRLAQIENERWAGRAAELYESVYAPRPPPQLPSSASASAEVVGRVADGSLAPPADGFFEGDGGGGGADSGGGDAAPDGARGTAFTFRAFAVEGGSSLAAADSSSTLAVRAPPPPSRAPPSAHAASPSRAWGPVRPAPAPPSPSMKIWAPRLEVEPPLHASSLSRGGGGSGGCSGACLGSSAGLDFDASASLKPPVRAASGSVVTVSMPTCAPATTAGPASYAPAVAPV